MRSYMQRLILCSTIALAAGCGGGGGGGGGGTTSTPATPDTTAPVIATASAPDSAFATPTITVSVTASDAVGVTAVSAVVATKYLSGQAAAAVGNTTLALTLSGGTWSRAIAFKANGTTAAISVPIAFTARDAAGNTSTTVSRQSVLQTNLAP